MWLPNTASVFAPAHKLRLDLSTLSCEGLSGASCPASCSFTAQGQDRRMQDKRIKAGRSVTTGLTDWTKGKLSYLPVMQIIPRNRLKWILSLNQPFIQDPAQLRITSDTAHWDPSSPGHPIERPPEPQTPHRDQRLFKPRHLSASWDAPEIPETDPPSAPRHPIQPSETPSTPWQPTQPSQRHLRHRYPRYQRPLSLRHPTQPSQRTLPAPGNPSSGY